MRNLFFLFIITNSVLFAFLTLTPETESLVENTKSKVEALRASTVNNMIEDNSIVVIDVRESSEWQESVIKSGKLVKISRSFLEFRYQKLILKKYKKSDKFVIYSALEPRAVLAASRLKELGFTNVFYLKGGLVNWKRKGYPTE